MSDTLRRNHLEFYGNKTVRTPNLDCFSKRSVVFDRCYACSFPTIPARADLFTGKWTYTYLGWKPLPNNETVLAQILQKEKYKTAAVVDMPFFTVDDMNYDRGFSDVMFIRGQGSDREDVYLQRRCETDWFAPKTMLTASRWLERHHKENFFLYVDTWEPHEPWDPPKWYVDYYYPDYDGKYSEPCYWFFKEAGLTEDDVKKAHAAYCGEVTMVDRWVGHLLDSIESMNLMDETAIIFTTDHGFYFGEHGMFGKALTRGQKSQHQKFYRSPLYEEVTHIPLLIYLPGVKARRIDEIVSLPDLMPTVLELMGLQIPKTVNAQSLVPLLMGEKQKRRDFVVTSPALNNLGGITKMVDNDARRLKEWPLSTITTKDWSLLYAAEGQPAELYNLTSDPIQKKNLINEKPQIAQELLEKFVKQMEEAGTKPRQINPRRRF